MKKNNKYFLIIIATIIFFGYLNKTAFADPTNGAPGCWIYTQSNIIDSSISIGGEPMSYCNGNSNIDWVPTQDEEKQNNWLASGKNSWVVFYHIGVTTDNPSVASCQGAAGFCQAAPSCNGDITCLSSLAKVYDQKAHDAIQAQIDSQVKSSGVDSTTAGDAVKSCGSDLVCVSSVLNGLAVDPTLVASTSTSVTASGLTNTTTSPDMTAANVIANKVPGPSVAVSFNNTSGVGGDLGGIQIGQKMTATAVPGGFSDADNSKLYFTWYIKHQGCDLTDANHPEGVDGDGKKIADDKDATKLENCDLDGDNIITVNDWKIAAVRENFRTSFDGSSASNYSNSLASDISAGAQANPAVDSSGGDHPWQKTYDHSLNNDANAADCYIQDGETGHFFELRNETPQYSCPDGMHIANLHDHNKNQKDETISCDDVSATPPTTSGLSYCQVSSEESITGDNSNWDNQNLECNLTNFDNYTTSVSSSNGDVPFCVANDGSSEDKYLTNPNFATLFNSQDKPICASTDTNCQNICSKEILKISTTGSYFGQTATANCNSFISSASTNTPTCTFIINSNSNDKNENVNYCKHLFPFFPQKDVTAVDTKAITLQSSEMHNGNGNFDIKQKEFWGADPSTDKTNGKDKDGAVVIGQGMNQLTWNYQAGDEVGVAVEGQSMLPTNHAGTTNKIMWAFSNGTCDKLGKIENDKSNVGFYVDASGQKTLTTNFDLDDCLPENLLDPTDSTSELSKKEVSLAANPTNPLNDETGHGDTVTVTSNVSNISDTSNLLYDWHIEESQAGAQTPSDTTQWKDITSDMANKYQSFSVDNSNGFGKTQFAFDMNLPDSFLQDGIADAGTKKDAQTKGTYYLRIKLNVNVDSGTQNGKVLTGATIIKVTQQQNQIQIYPVSAGADGDLKLVKSISNASTELTKQECDSSACYVTQNQVVGVQIPDANGTQLSNFSWKINGNNFACNASISKNDCAKPGGNTLFFPVLGNVGEAVDVVATATNATTSATVQVSKHFVIVAPTAQIISSDQTLAWPKVLGYYRDASGKPTIPDVSTQVLETRTGNKITLNAQFYPVSVAGQLGYQWTIDGQTAQADPKNPGQLTLTIDKSAGDSYTIGITGTRTSDADQQAVYMRNALAKNWGANLDDTANVNNSASVQINVLDSTSVAQSSQNANFAASLITHLPEQMMFLLKITITAFTLLFFTGILFAFIPEPLFNDEDNRY